MGAVVSAVEGELSKEGLGLSEHNRSLLAGAGVTHVLHCAASVRFNDPLPEAASTNVTGALRVAALAASWPSCRCGWRRAHFTGRIVPFRVARWRSCPAYLGPHPGCDSILLNRHFS